MSFDRAVCAGSAFSIQVQEAFCNATGARNFFTLQDEDTKRLMHGAVVTAYGAGGHIFFEDISLNPFKDTLKVPFVDYRCNNQSHIILLLSCKAKQQWNWQVYIDMNLLRSAGQSRVCFNLRPFHFLFGLVVWYLPLAGCALFTWLCQGMRMFPMHQSWQQRCWSPTLVEYAQLLDMFKTGGHGVSRAFPIHHTTTGIPCGDLWWFKSVVPSPPLPKHTTATLCQLWSSKTKEVIPVQKQFWGAEFGILRDGCGLLWALSTKAEGDMEASPYPPPVRSCVSVPDADGYLKFLKEAFGHLMFKWFFTGVGHRPMGCFFTVAIENASCKLDAKGQIWNEMGKVWKGQDLVHDYDNMCRATDPLLPFSKDVWGTPERL